MVIDIVLPELSRMLTIRTLRPYPITYIVSPHLFSSRRIVIITILHLDYNPSSNTTVLPQDLKQSRSIIIQRKRLISPNNNTIVLIRAPKNRNTTILIRADSNHREGHRIRKIIDLYNRCSYTILS